MFYAINRMPNGIGSTIVGTSNDILATLLGKMCSETDTCYMVEFYKVVCSWVNRMYRRAISERDGVGYIFKPKSCLRVF